MPEETSEIETTVEIKAVVHHIIATWVNAGIFSYIPNLSTRLRYGELHVVAPLTQADKDNIVDSIQTAQSISESLQHNLFCSLT